MVRYFKHKIIYFICFLGVGFCLFSTIGKSLARENAYLSCLIDDESYMYKTQVLYSGLEIEMGRIVPFNNLEMSISNSSDLLNVQGYSLNEQESIFVFHDRTCSIDKNTGKITIKVATEDSEDLVDGREISSDTWSKSYNTAAANKADSINTGTAVGDITHDVVSGQDQRENEQNSKKPAPLTFPTNQNYSAGEADINRAYVISDTLGENFRDALLYVNDGKGFTSVDSLIDTAYALVTTNSGVLQNQYGTRYRVVYNGGTSDYLYTCHITRISASYVNGVRQEETDREMDFIYAMKKGYMGCSTGDYFEDGSKNNLNPQKSSEGDTKYITWQQLFLEAGILYAEGVSYSNCADLYELEDFEESLIKVARNFMAGIQNKLQLYSSEDCLFNNSIRGSRAFVYGVYKTDYNTSIVQIYLVILALALSLTAASLVIMIIKKQWSVASPMARFSLMMGLKDLVFVVAGMGFLWISMKFVFACNYKLVGIWNTYLDGKTMSSTGGYNSLSAIMYVFIFFVIKTYVNVIYILRGLIVPALMFISPICVFVYSFGTLGKKVTLEWLKEFLGAVFIQSFHACVYGFILGNSTGLRGIEALVVYASIIPLTSVIRKITGLGGDELLRKGRSLTTSVGGAIGAGVQAGAGIEAAKVQSDALVQGAKAQMGASGVGAFAQSMLSGLGMAASVALPGPGMAVGAGLNALGQGIGAGANMSGSMKNAQIVAEGTRKAAGISTAGGMFNAAMGAGLSAVLDSGDGQMQAGVATVSDSQRRSAESEGWMYQQQAQAAANFSQHIPSLYSPFAANALNQTSQAMQQSALKQQMSSFNMQQKARISQGLEPQAMFSGRSGVEILRDQGGRATGYRESYPVASADQIRNSGVSKESCYSVVSSAYHNQDRSSVGTYANSHGLADKDVVSLALDHATENNLSKSSIGYISNGSQCENVERDGNHYLSVVKNLDSQPSAASVVDRSRQNYERSMNI